MSKIGEAFYERWPHMRLSLKSGNGWWSKHTSMIGKTIYIENTAATIDDILAHEGTHLAQKDLHGKLGYIYRYWFPMWLLPLAVPLWMTYWALGVAFILGVLLLPLGAVQLELQAYAYSLLLRGDKDSRRYAEVVHDRLKSWKYGFASRWSLDVDKVQDGLVKYITQSAEGPVEDWRQVCRTLRD